MQETETKAKYCVGQVVWFYAMAGSTDDIIAYPCVGKGRIADIHPAGEFSGSFKHEETLYSMQDSGGYMFVKEKNIYPDSPDEAIKRLDKAWDVNWHYAHDV